MQSFHILPNQRSPFSPPDQSTWLEVYHLHHARHHEPHQTPGHTVLHFFV